MLPGCIPPELETKMITSELVCFQYYSISVSIRNILGYFSHSINRGLHSVTFCLRSFQVILNIHAIDNISIWYSCTHSNNALSVTDIYIFVCLKVLCMFLKRDMCCVLIWKHISQCICLGEIERRHTSQCHFHNGNNWTAGCSVIKYSSQFYHIIYEWKEPYIAVRVTLKQMFCQVSSICWKCN